MLGKADFRQPAGVLYGGPVYHVPYGDAGAVEKQFEICRAVGVDIAAVLMEPIQGEAGAIVPPDDFWPRLREVHQGLRRPVHRRRGADRITWGRTGKLWGDHDCTWRRTSSRREVTGAGRRDAGERWLLLDRGDQAGDDVPQPVHPHLDDDGGALRSAATAIAAINVTLRDRLWEVAAAEAYLIPKLNALAAATIRRFMLRLSPPQGSCSSVSISTTRKSATRWRPGTQYPIVGVAPLDTIRIEPPLVITYEQIDAVLDRLADTLAEIQRGM